MNSTLDGKIDGVRPFFDVVGHHDDRLHAFRAHLVRDIRHGQRAVDRLAAGHRDRVVVENLVGDVDLRRDRLPDRERAGVEIRAVAEVLEDVLRLGERRLAAPRRAFAAHLREGFGAAIHPRHHVMATDAAERARAFRHRRRRVVRAAGAVMRGAREIGARQREFFFFFLDPAQARRDGSLVKNLPSRFAITCAIIAGVSSFVDGSTHSPASSYLPTIDGRVEARPVVHLIPSSAIR